ncbi:MAG: hypothetical protein AAF708_22795, partial [Deinococcota bacterium]
GMAGRRVALITLTVIVANGLAGYTHWRNVPMPWDDVVRSPDYVTETAWSTLESWVRTPSSAPWNVLEPSFPRIEGIFALPQASTSRQAARSRGFAWSSSYFLRASGQRITGRFNVTNDGRVRNVYGFLRLPASPYLRLTQTAESSLLELNFSPTANLSDHNLTAWLTVAGSRVSSEQTNLTTSGAQLIFPRVNMSEANELVVVLREPAADRVVSWRFHDLADLARSSS